MVPLLVVVNHVFGKDGAKMFFAEFFGVVPRILRHLLGGAPAIADDGRTVACDDVAAPVATVYPFGRRCAVNRNQVVHRSDSSNDFSVPVGTGSTPGTYGVASLQLVSGSKDCGTNCRKTGGTTGLIT